MNEAFQTFERCHLARKRYPKFFEEDIEDSMKMFHSGFCYPLKGHDEKGRKIVLVQPKWDTRKYSISDAIRLFFYISNALLEEEETQIGGMIFIFDYAQLTLDRQMSPFDLMEFLDFINKCSAARQKGNFLLNLPKFTQILVEVGRSMMSEKLKKRLHILRDKSDLKNYINPVMLPSEYGGTISEAEMMQEFLEFQRKHIENLHNFYNFKVDWSKVPPEKIRFDADDDDNVGSFRKLEID